MTPTAKYTPLSGLAFCSVQRIQFLGCALYGLPVGILHHVGIDFDPYHAAPHLVALFRTPSLTLSSHEDSRLTAAAR